MEINLYSTYSMCYKMKVWTDLGRVRVRIEIDSSILLVYNRKSAYNMEVM